MSTQTTLPFTVKTRPGCSACQATIRHLQRRGVEPTLIQLPDSGPEIEALRDAGLTALPIVEVGGQVWTGYQPTRIDAALGL